MPPSTPPAENPSVTDGPGPGLDSERAPDDVFAVVGGLTAALVVAPLATGLLARLYSDPGILYSGLLGGALVTTVLGAVAVRRVPGLPEWLGATRRRWLPALLAPAVPAVAIGVLYATGRYTGFDGALGVVAGLGGFAGGAILGIMARTRYARAVTEGAETLAAWRAGWPDRRRRSVQLLGGAAMACGGVAFVVSVVWDTVLLRSAGHLLVPLGAAVATLGQPRRYSATTAGLETKLPAARTLSDWAGFEGYAVTDDAVVLHRRAPWRLPLFFDRADLDDEAAVVGALDRHLPRLPAR